MTAPVCGEWYSAARSSSELAHGVAELSRGGVKVSWGLWLSFAAIARW